MVAELYMPIMTQGDGEITLHQTLMSLRSKINYECTILQAFNKHAVTGTITALCHSGYGEEANKVMMNLVTFCNGRFGHKTTTWFTQDAVEESTDQMHNRATNTIDVDKTKLNAETEIFDIFGDHAIEAE